MAITNGTSAAPLPPTKIHRIAPDVNLLEPLSRRGTGPGIVAVVHETGLVSDHEARIEDGVPSGIMKWAEEGYAVVELLPEVWESGERLPLVEAVDALRMCKTCEPKGQVGLICNAQMLSLSSTRDNKLTCNQATTRPRGQKL